MAGITPGPWDKFNRVKNEWADMPKEVSEVCEFYSLDNNLGEYTKKERSTIEANARLISASPDLYAVVKNLVHCMDAEPDGFHPSFIRSAKEALAKVEVPA